MSQRTAEEKWGRGAQPSDMISPMPPRIAGLATFYQEAYGHPLPSDGKRATDLRLAVEKFKAPGDKHYRLIWTGKGRACLAAEDVTHYPTHGRALLAARLLAVKLGVVVDGRRR